MLNSVQSLPSEGGTLKNTVFQHQVRTLLGQYCDHLVIEVEWLINL